MATTYNPRIVTNGMVLCLDAANAQSYPGSGTTWTDLSGGGVTATLTNGPTFSSTNRGYISFDGTNDHCILSPVPAITGAAATFCVWNYGIRLNNASSAIWLQNASRVRQFQVHLAWNDSTVYFDAAGDVGGTFDRISKAVTNAEYLGWHHWTFIKDSVAGTMLIYRNGVLWHSGSGLTRQIGTITAAYIGVMTNFSSGLTENYHQGYISNLQFYNRVLSAAEIQQNFNATRGRFGV